MDARLRRPMAATTLALLGALALAGTAGATVWTVTRTDDPAPGSSCVLGNCSLRQAIAMESPVAGDSVVLPASATPYTLSRALGRIVLAKSLTLTGAGARTTTISGGNATALFSIAGPGSPVVSIAGLTLTGGYDIVSAPGTPAGGGAITPAFPLATTVTLSLTDAAVLANRAYSAGSNTTGGAISTTVGWTTTLRRVLVARNEAEVAAPGPSVSTAFGAGIASGGTLTVIDSTIADNKAIADSSLGGAQGGGISSAGTLTLQNVTLAGNTVVNTAVATSSSGGNLTAGSSGANHLTLENTLVAGGSAGQAASANCQLTGSNPPISLGGNLDSLDQCGLGAGDLRRADPRLGPLADHGGATDTRALLAGSPALRAGAAAHCTTSDQRGFARPVGCSIGAYEPQAPTVVASAPATGAVARPVTFTATAAELDLGEALSAVWHFDDGGSAAGLVASHAFATSGRHGGTVTVSDPLGLVASAGATVGVSASPLAMTKLALTPATFRAAGRGAALAARRRRRPPVGASVSFTLSDAAKVTFTLQHAVSGRRVGGRCVKATRGNRRARSCSRWVAAKGSAVVAGKPGAQSLRFSGRWRGRALAPGAYRLAVVAADAGGHAAAPQRRAFAIVR